MANITVTSTTNSINVDFGDLVFFDRRDGTNYGKGTWAKIGITQIKLSEAGDKVVVQEREGLQWILSHDGAEGTMEVDSVGGAAITSNEQLYDELIALIA